MISDAKILTISIEYHDLVPLIQQSDSCVPNDLCLQMYFSVLQRAGEVLLKICSVPK